MFLFIISFLITALGVPALVPYLGPLAALCGYALFWKSILLWPSKKQRFWGGLLWYGAVQLVQLFWMTSIDYQGIYILFVYLALALFLGVQWGFFTLFVKKENSLPAILALASLWTLIEWSRFFLLCGFSWNLSGLCLACYLPSMQMASIAGILGLTFWVMLVNLGVLHLFSAQNVRSYFSWGVVALIPYLFGICHISYHEKKREDRPLKVVLLQTGLLPSQKVPLQGKTGEFISPYVQWKRILELLKEKNQADLIVLPEGALPCLSSTPLYSFEKTAKIFQEVFGEGVKSSFPLEGSHFYSKTKTGVSNCFWAQTVANHLHTELVIGLDHMESDKSECYNSAHHFSPENGISSRYDKRILLPLAEYLPFQWLYPLVKNYGITDFFTEGVKSSIFQGAVPLAPSICYEETFPHLIRQGRLNGGEILVNITNDGWYPHSNLAKQHFYHARLRSVENGAPLIRSCNTGITAAVDSLGKVVGQLPEVNEKGESYSGVLEIKLNSYHYPTLYTFWGDWCIIIISIMFIFSYVLMKIKTN